MNAATIEQHEVTADNRPYEPRGAALKLMPLRDRVVLIAGPAGTGKTRAVLEKVYLFAHNYPGSRVLICRKTRASMTQSVLVTWESKVVPAGHPCLNGPMRSLRQSYSFPNGSEVVVGGLDSPERTFSTEYDLICIFEATELVEGDAESLFRALRNGKAAYHQMILDCNPASTRHWLKQWADTGKATHLLSRHADNPACTPEYLATLELLTGARRRRLLLGEWCDVEGAVYESFDAAVHIIDRFDVPHDWRRFRSIDFGYTNPFVCQWWAVDGDGRAYLYREVYETGLLVADAAEKIKQLDANERIEMTVADHDAEDRATLSRAGIVTVRAKKDINTGVQAVESRLRKAGDGRPRLFIMRDSVVRRDPALVEARKPFCTEHEFDSYVWPQGVDGKPLKEEPVKANDHGMDAMRYLVMHLDGGVVPSARWLTGKPAAAFDPRTADLSNPRTWAELRKDPNFGFEDEDD